MQGAPQQALNFSWMLSFPRLGQSKARFSKAPCLPWMAPGLSGSLPLAKHSCGQLLPETEGGRSRGLAGHGSAAALEGSQPPS